MKKLLLTAAVVSMAAGATLAQDGEYKPTAGNKTLEANINIFGLGDNENEKRIVSLSNGLNQIKGRYFINDNTALRLGFNIGLNNKTSKELDGNDDEIITKERIFTLSLSPGIEKHFEGTERLSPFIGVELAIALDSRKTTVDTEDDTFVTEGRSQGEPGSFFFGANAIAGFDYYVARHLFVGYELGFGLGVRSINEVTVDGDLETPGSSQFEIGPNVRNGIRVGFVF